MSRVDATNPKPRTSSSSTPKRTVRAAPPDHREPAARALAEALRPRHLRNAPPDHREANQLLLSAAIGHAHRQHTTQTHPHRMVVRGVPIEPHGGGIDLGFAADPAREFIANANRHLFLALMNAAMQKENEKRYGRPQENPGGRLLTQMTGLSPADRALVAEGSRTGAQLLSYAVPPVANPEVSDAMVALPYVMRRFSREANRQAQERALLRIQSKRAAQGLPPLDPTQTPRNLHEFMQWLKHPASGVSSNP
jgi:hypothetical protein